MSSATIYDPEAFAVLQRRAMETRAEDEDRQAYYNDNPDNAARWLAAAQQKRIKTKYDNFQAIARKRDAKIAIMTQENLRSRQVKKDAQYVALCEELAKGDVLGKALGERLRCQDASDARRRVTEFTEWTENVYNPIHDPITSSLASLSAKALTKRRCDAYQRFLDKTNTKGALFLDIVCEEEYNPLADNPSLKVTLPPLSDPTSRVLQKKAQEDAIASSAPRPSGGKTTLCRPDLLDVKLWQSQVFESTPHGYFSALMAKPQDPNYAATHPGHQSRLVFDHYHTLRSNAAVKAECPLGLRTTFPFEPPAAQSHICLTHRDTGDT